MALSRNTPGTPAIWSIGRAGEPADHYPVRTIDQPRLATQNGRLVEVVTVIALRKNQAGEAYTTEQLLNTRFLENRSTRCEPLDGPKGTNKTVAELIEEHKASVAAFQANRTSELSVEALTALVD